MDSLLGRTGDGPDTLPWLPTISLNAIGLRVAPSPGKNGLGKPSSVIPTGTGDDIMVVPERGIGLVGIGAAGVLSPPPKIFKKPLFLCLKTGCRAFVAVVVVALVWVVVLLPGVLLELFS